MNYNGIIIGAAVFLSIGLCHPLVIKMEYRWGKQSWWIWLVAGLLFSALSLFVENDIVSIIIGGFAFCCLWGIHEMFLQEMRVLRGWFPENPARHSYYEKRREEMKGILSQDNVKHHHQCKAQQDLLQHRMHLLFHEENEGRAQGSTQERNQKRY